AVTDYFRIPLTGPKEQPIDRPSREVGPIGPESHAVDIVGVIADGPTATPIEPGHHEATRTIRDDAQIEPRRLSADNHAVLWPSRRRAAGCGQVLGGGGSVKRNKHTSVSIQRHNGMVLRTRTPGDRHAVERPSWRYR